MVEPKTDHEIALVNACMEGRIDEIKGLLNLNLIRLNGKRYFDYYLIIKALDNGQCDIANLLIQKGFRVYKKSKPTQEKTLLHTVIQFGYHELLETLLTKGASADILSFNEHNQTPFHLAINKNELSVVSIFLDQFSAEAFDGKCLLHYAIEKNNIKVVSQLVAHGLSVKKKDEKNSTPFCLALKNENYIILDILLSSCSVKTIKTNNYDDTAPAYIATICGNVKFIKNYIHFGLPVDIPHKDSTKSWSSLEKYCGFTLLHFAVKHVKLEVVRLLISLGADILVKNENGSTPLHIAFETKEIGVWKTWEEFDDINSIIDQILIANTKLQSNPINKNKLSHFHIACSRDEPKVVEHFLNLGASINQQVKSQCHRYKKYSPLHLAAKFRCKQTMELLLRKGANVKQKDSQDMTVLHIAVRESSREIVELLLEYGADVASADSDGKTPVHWAFENKNYKILDLLLSVSNFAKSNPTNREGVSHFHIACTRNNVDVVKRFIEQSRAVIDICVPTKLNVSGNSDDVSYCSGYSPLHFAVSHNKAKIVQLLLESGANVGMKSSWGSIPLHLTCQYTHEMFGDLIENILNDLKKQGKIFQNFKPLTDVTMVSEKYFNELKSYARKIDWSPNRVEHMKVINLLLSHGSDVNGIDSVGQTPVLYAYLSFREVKYIVEHNLNHLKVIVRSQIFEDFSRAICEDLSREIYERRKLILNNLLKLDVDLEKCFKGRSILHYIVLNHEDDEEGDEMLELFLRRGANVNVSYDDLTAFHCATFFEKKSVMQILLKYGADVDCVDSRTNATPLLFVTQKSTRTWLTDVGVVKILLDNGANPNARKFNGRTAIHNIASRSTDPFGSITQALSILIKAGADINSRDANGDTPLHLACKLENTNVEELLMHGADINVENNEGKNVCCRLYDVYEQNTLDGQHNHAVKWVMHELKKHIIKMKVIGLPVSQKVLSSCSKVNHILGLWTLEKKTHFTEKYQTEVEREVELLRDTKIRGTCTLFDVIFKNENVLSHLAKIREFKLILQPKSFEKKFKTYGYLVRLKYQAGVDRGNLLPEAKYVLNNLAGLPLPDTCSENICRYFTNAELRESIGILRGVLDLNVDRSDNIQLRSRRLHKRQKIN